jgi:hypothetical protein
MAGDATKVLAGRNFIVYAAPYATTNTFPTQSPWGTAWGAPYIDKGYTTGNVRVTVGFTRTDIRVDQLIDPVARIATGRTITLNTSLAQITAANLRDGTGNGTVTSFVATATSITPPNAAPGVATATTGGTIVPGTYVVGFAWVNANGQTTLSPTATIVVPAGTNTNTITVTVPALPAGATSAAVYMSQAGGTALTQQGTTATTTYTQTAPLTTTGAVPNTSNLTGTRSYDDIDFSSVITDSYYTVGYDVQQQGNGEAMRVVAWKGLPTGTPAIAVAPNAPSAIAYDITALPDDSVSPSRILKIRFNQAPI